MVLFGQEEHAPDDSRGANSFRSRYSPEKKSKKNQTKARETKREERRNQHALKSIRAFDVDVCIDAIRVGDNIVAMDAKVGLLGEIQH